MNLLISEESKLRAEYNRSFRTGVGSIDPTIIRPIKDDMLTIIETCQEFEDEHLRSIGEKDNVYTGDDAFPDSYNHQFFLQSRQIDQRKVDYDVSRTKSIWEKIKAHALADQACAPRGGASPRLCGGSASMIGSAALTF